MSSEEAIALLRQRHAEIAAEVEATKRRALAEGKEPFDLDRFDGLYTAPHADFHQQVPREEWVRRREKEYYIGRGYRAKTLQEFAEIMRDHDQHDWT